MHDTSASMGYGTGIPAEKLRLLGKQAAALHLRSGTPMSEAVYSVLGTENGLGPEHVRRVVEFANNDAFQGKFDQENGDHRVINFDGGPADPAEVLKELNMGATPTAVRAPATFGDLFDEDDFVPGSDGAGDLFDTEKEASAAFDMPSANPYGDLVRLRDHLSTARQGVLSQLTFAELNYEATADRLYKEAKQLVMSGQSPAEVSLAITAASGEHRVMVKEALAHISSMMEREDIRMPIVPKPISKFASNRVVNLKHPLLTAFHDFSKAASERYNLAEQVETFGTQLTRVNRALMEVMR